MSDNNSRVNQKPGGYAPPKPSQMTSRCNQSKNVASNQVSGSNGSFSSSVIYNRTEISQIPLRMRLKGPTRTSPILYKTDNKILQGCLYVRFSNGPDNRRS